MGALPSESFHGLGPTQADQGRSTVDYLFPMLLHVACGIPRIYYQFGVLHDLIEIIAGVIGRNQYTVIFSQPFRGQFHRSHFREIVVPHLK